MKVAAILFVALLFLPLAMAEPTNPRPLCEGQVFDAERCYDGARVYVCGYDDALHGAGCIVI